MVKVVNCFFKFLFQMYEDPMHNFVQENKRKEKEERYGLIMLR